MGLEITVSGVALFDTVYFDGIGVWVGGNLVLFSVDSVKYCRQGLYNSWCYSSSTKLNISLHCNLWLPLPISGTDYVEDNDQLSGQGTFLPYFAVLCSSSLLGVMMANVKFLSNG